MMRILVTGITGFAGGFLAEALLQSRDVQLWGVSRPGTPPVVSPAVLTWAACDLADRSAVMALIQQAQPDQIYHLAGYASTGRSYQEPDAAWEGNLTATRNLIAAVIAWGGRPRILHVSSGLVYGEPKDADQLVDEDAPLRPASPYAASKAAADLAVYQASRAAGLPIIRVRPFNHIGPRQSPDFAVSHFAQQLAAIEAGRQPPVVETGDLRPRRDLTDVRDMVRAYLLLMDKGKPGDAYNAGSGEARSMQEVLERLLTLSRVRPEVRQQTQPERAREAAALRADCRKLRAATGWAPHYSLDQTLTDTLEYWRKTISA